MNNLSSYCGLVDAKIRASDKDLPVLLSTYNKHTSDLNVVKVRTFWEGHKILRYLHCRFDLYYTGQIYGGDFAKICGLLRIYEL